MVHSAKSLRLSKSAPAKFASSTTPPFAAQLVNCSVEFFEFTQNNLYSDCAIIYKSFLPANSADSYAAICAVKEAPSLDAPRGDRMKQLERNGKAHALLRDSFETHVLDDVHEKISSGRVHEGMSELLPALQTMRLNAGEPQWKEFVQQCLNHPLRELVHQDPFTYRAFSKPRGYAGDAVLLDYIYGREEGWSVPPETTELGQQIFDFTTRSMACEGVRARRGFIADVLDHFVEQTPRPHVLSIAAGHLREALLCAAVKRRKIGRFVAFDQDEESLTEVRRCYGSQGVTPVHGSIRQLLLQKVDLGHFDLVYSTGLFDYVPLNTAQRLTWVMFQMLRSRGRLLVANFLPGILDLGYMETYMGWNLIYRTRTEMLQVSDRIPQSEIRDIRLFAEDNQNIIFLEITKK